METTSRRRRVYTEQQRREYVDGFECSGLSQAQFCRQANIHPVTFSLWRRAAKTSAPAFAEVQLSAPMPVPGPVATLRLPDGAMLEVPVGAEASWHGLGLLLKSLQS